MQEELKDKMKSLHAMKAELDMRHAQVDDYKFNMRQMQVGWLPSSQDPSNAVRGWLGFPMFASVC